MTEERNSEVIISGNNLELTEALKTSVREKMSKLFNHEPHIVRIRVELNYSHHKTQEKEFVAKGHVELRGSDLNASVESEDLYHSIDLLEEKLNRMIRRRARLKKVKRKDKHDVEIPAEIPKVKIA